MTARIEIDPDVLSAVRQDLLALAEDVPVLAARARGLQVGHLLTPLSTSADWARTSATDLQERLDLLARADQLDTGGLATLGFSVQDVAGARGPVLDSLVAVDELLMLQRNGAPLDWSRLPQESLDDYVTRMVERGIATGLSGPAGEAAGAAYDLYGTYNGLLVSGAWTIAALQRFNLAYRGRPWLAALANSPRMAEYTTVSRYLASLSVPSAMTAPFTSSGLAGGQAVRGLLALQNPAVLTARLADLENLLVRSGHPGLAGRVPAVAPVISGVASRAPLWFGQAWTAPSGITVARGSTNLLTVARTSGVRTAASTSGLWRGAGIVGGVAAITCDAANLYVQGNPVQAFRREGAGYVADLARTGFDVSLTAAMIAPTPWTWGAVAVTGVVWAGAEIVDNWPAISNAVGEATDRAVDWGEDRLDDVADVAGDVADGFGDAAQAVAESDANPMNWF